MGSDPTGLPLRLEGHGRGALITPEDAERLRRSAIFNPSRLNLLFYRAIFPLNFRVEEDWAKKGVRYHQPRRQIAQFDVKPSGIIV